MGSISGQFMNRSGQDTGKGRRLVGLLGGRKARADDGGTTAPEFLKQSHLGRRCKPVQPAGDMPPRSIGAG